jgi:hypothetical protein
MPLSSASGWRQDLWPTLYMGAFAAIGLAGGIDQIPGELLLDEEKFG